MIHDDGRVSLLVAINKMGKIIEDSTKSIKYQNGTEDIYEILEVKGEDYFFTQQRYNQWQEAMAENKVQLDHTEKSDKKFGNTSNISDRALWLPSSVTLTDEDLQLSCKKINDFLKS